MGSGILKEMYFNDINIRDEVENMLHECVFGKNSKIYSDDFKNCALLVLDMQDYFLVPSSHAFVPSAPAIIKNINKLIYLFKKNQLPVIFTKHINKISDAGQMNHQWNEIIKEDNILSKINIEIDYKGLPVLKKTQYDAFYNTSLSKHLRSKHINTVIICGLLTHLCCETTARSAFVQGYKVFFPADGSVTYNKKFHAATLYNLSHGFAAITKISDIIELIEQKKDK